MDFNNYRENKIIAKTVNETVRVATWHMLLFPAQTGIIICVY